MILQDMMYIYIYYMYTIYIYIYTIYQHIYLFGLQYIRYHIPTE